MSKPAVDEILVPQPDALFGRIVSILEQAQGNVVRAVNTQMVLASRVRQFSAQKSAHPQWNQSLSGVI